MERIARKWTGNRELKGRQAWRFVMLALIAAHGLFVLVTWILGGYGSQYAHFWHVVTYFAAMLSLDRIRTHHRVAMRLSDLQMQLGAMVWVVMLVAFISSLTSGIYIYLDLTFQHVLESRAAFPVQQ